LIRECGFSAPASRVTAHDGQGPAPRAQRWHLAHPSTARPQSHSGPPSRIARFGPNETRIDRLPALAVAGAGSADHRQSPRVSRRGSPESPGRSVSDRSSCGLDHAAPRVTIERPLGNRAVVSRSTFRTEPFHVKRLQRRVRRGLRQPEGLTGSAASGRDANGRPDSNRGPRTATPRRGAECSLSRGVSRGTSAACRSRSAARRARRWLTFRGVGTTETPDQRGQIPRPDGPSRRGAVSRESPTGQCPGARLRRLVPTSRNGRRARIVPRICFT
jgi:hypothetical protein